jgi:myo-inositol-1(or 4)-monophosphatase
VSGSIGEFGEVARRAALAGGRAIVGAGARARGRVRSKGAGDYVTEVDRESEAAITALLGAETPGIPILAEEGGGTTGDRYWVVDPLDGTANFVHGFPIVGVSVALIQDGRPVAGCVHSPFLDQTFVGARGGGAWLHQGDSPGTRLRVSRRPVERAIVGTGFPFRRKDLLPRYLRAMTVALERFEDLRRPGAAALDLAWVAAGVFDGFFELGLSSWDVAAGGLLIQEAGGVVTDWSGGEGWLGGDILAGSPEVQAALLELAGRATG